MLDDIKFIFKLFGTIILVAVALLIAGIIAFYGSAIFFIFCVIAFVAFIVYAAWHDYKLNKDSKK